MMTMAKVKVAAVAGVVMLAVAGMGMAAERSANATVGTDAPAERTPPKLSEAMERWTSDEKRSADAIGKEGFAESIAMMADWDSSYMKIVMDVQPLPTLPESLNLILGSRRFAKLLEDTRGGVTPEQRVALQEGMRHDTDLLRKLVDGGQSFDSGGQLYYTPDKKSEELLAPLTYRINAQVLLIGERNVTECLPEVLDVPDAMGEHTNWCGVAYACDKILTQMSSASVSDQQRQVLREYATWREQNRDSGLFAYQSKTLPSSSSAQRPFERATSTGAPVDVSKGTIVVEFPVTYKVLRTRSDNGKVTYLDAPSGLTGSKTAAAKEVVAFARRVAALRK